MPPFFFAPSPVYPHSPFTGLVRQQLDKTLSLFGFARNMQPPVKDWIRAVREALGMSGTQLAQRLQVSQPRIPKLEQDER